MTHHYYHYPNTCWSIPIPTNGTTKRIPGISSSQYGNARNNKEAPTTHPHHCSKILFQNEDSHSSGTQKTKFGSDSSLSLSKYRAVGQSQPTVRRQNVTQQQVSAAAVRNARKRKKKLWRLILITAVKFYSKMKTPTQKNEFGSDSSLSLSKYRLVNPMGIPSHRARRI